jgi:hypothetical protein
MSTTGANKEAAEFDFSQQGAPTSNAKARGERGKLLARLEQIEQQAFEDYVQTARRDGGSQCAVSQGYIELTRRIWQNAQKALRDVRERMG